MDAAKHYADSNKVNFLSVCLCILEVFVIIIIIIMIIIMIIYSVQLSIEMFKCALQ